MHVCMCVCMCVRVCKYVHVCVRECVCARVCAHPWDTFLLTVCTSFRGRCDNGPQTCWLQSTKGTVFSGPLGGRSPAVSLGQGHGVGVPGPLQRLQERLPLPLSVREPHSSARGPFCRLGPVNPRFHRHIVFSPSLPGTMSQVAWRLLSGCVGSRAEDRPPGDLASIPLKCEQPPFSFCHLTASGLVAVAVHGMDVPQLTEPTFCTRGAPPATQKLPRAPPPGGPWAGPSS